MGNGYFYTLSAIAQSFAAIIALNGIFVVYKLQVLHKRRNECFTRLRDLRYRIAINRGERPDFANVRSERITEEDLLTEARSRTGGESDIPERTRKVLHDYEICEQLEPRIKMWLKKTLLLNGSVLICSLLLLPWKEYFLTGTIETLVIIMLVFSLCALVVTVHAVLVTLEIRGISLIDKLLVARSRQRTSVS